MFNSGPSLNAMTLAHLGGTAYSLIALPTVDGEGFVTDAGFLAVLPKRVTSLHRGEVTIPVGRGFVDRYVPLKRHPIDTSPPDLGYPEPPSRLYRGVFPRHQ